jgi:hypothetical protein
MRVGWLGDFVLGREHERGGLRLQLVELQGKGVGGRLPEFSVYNVLRTLDCSRTLSYSVERHQALPMPCSPFTMICKQSRFPLQGKKHYLTHNHLKGSFY